MACFQVKRVTRTMTTPQFIAKNLPAYNKEVFHVSLFKESGLLQGRKRNYRTIITSKCKKGGDVGCCGERGGGGGGGYWLMGTRPPIPVCEIQIWSIPWLCAAHLGPFRLPVCYYLSKGS